MPRKLVDGYTAATAQKSATGIAALYTKDGALVNPSGVHTDLVKLYETSSRMAWRSKSLSSSNVWPLNDGTVLTEG